MGRQRGKGRVKGGRGEGGVGEFFGVWGFTHFECFFNDFII